MFYITQFLPVIFPFLYHYSEIFSFLHKGLCTAIFHRRSLDYFFLLDYFRIKSGMKLKVRINTKRFTSVFMNNEINPTLYIDHYCLNCHTFEARLPAVEDFFQITPHSLRNIRSKYIIKPPPLEERSLR